MKGPASIAQSLVRLTANQGVEIRSPGSQDFTGLYVKFVNNLPAFTH